MNSHNGTQRLATLGISWTLAMTLAMPAVLASPPAHALERARQAVSEGSESAKGLGNADAKGQEQKAKGLERAGQALAAAAARRAEREGEDFPGQGKALGRGHSDAVHAILAGGGSPSDLDSHGAAVATLAKAFDKVKADHPGQGEGLTKDKPERGAGELEPDDD